MPPSLNDYRLFDQIVATGSLAKAAARLHFSPSAASHSLMKMESEMGVQLVKRNKKGIELTINGRELLPYIRSLLNMEMKLQAETERLSGAKSKSIRIGTINSVCCSWLPHIIHNLITKHPQIELYITQGGYDDMESGLEAGSLDFAFVSIPVRKKIPAFPLYRDRLLCITPKGISANDPNCITIQELKEHNFILPGEGSDFDARAFMSRNNLMIETTHDLIDDTSIVALVESGLGISIIPELALSKVHGDINTYPIECAPFRTIGFATQNTDYITSAVKLFITEVQDYIASRYPSDLPYFREL